jgi:hypothetical protein
VQGGFHLPYASFVPLLSPAIFAAVHRVEYVLVALLLVGLATRVACASLLVLQGWVFFADRMNFRNHPYFFLLVLALLLVSPCDETLSVRAWLRGRRTLDAMLHPPARALTAQRLIQLQITIVYVYAALMKLNPQYLSGSVIAQQAATWLGRDGSGAGDLAAPGAVAAGVALAAGGVADAPERAPLWIALAWGSIALELFLATALWSPRLRAPAMLLGGLFHLGLGVLMQVWTFSVSYLAAYLLFLDPETLPRTFERAFARRRSKAA